MMNKKRIGLKDLRNARAAHQAFACLTAYDASFARLMETAGVDLILVGDSLGMVIQGHSTTLPVTVEELHYHCSCVVRATERAMIMVDMPFLSDITLEEGLRNAKHLMQAGAQVIKIEAGMRQIELVRGLFEVASLFVFTFGLRLQQHNRALR
ncbi:MAG: 3-methyl-2-oxobutanoate hydroxymethyltransferase [Candidatus Oxydemutatoraceae bacterium WSBS_2016_MAG_OTU14]